MRLYSLRSRNPLVAGALVIVALVALAAAFMVGIVILGTLAVAGVVLAGAILVRRKLARIRGERPPSDRSLEGLDPAMEVHQDHHLLHDAHSADSVDQTTAE